MNKQFRQKLIRSGGPLLSVLLHVLVIYAMIHFVVYSTSSVTPDLETKLAQDEQIDLDQIKELEPLEPLQDVNEALTDDSDVPPLLEDVAQQLAEVQPDSASLLDELPTMLSADSPLTFKALGGDSQSMGALEGRYGARAKQNGLLGSYYNSVDFTGPVLMRIDETLNKNWGENSPWPGKIRSDLFSVIWTGRIVPRRSGHYTLYLRSDDAARLWINDKLVLDQFTEHKEQEDRIEIELLAGISYDVKYAFCDVFVHAVSVLEWSSEDAGIQKQLVPVDCLWADGISTRELLKWNGQQGGRFVNRSKMRNPALLGNEPFSHLVDYKKVIAESDVGYLERIQVPELVQDFKSFKAGHVPSQFKLPSGRDETPAPRATSKEDEDVEITIF